MPTTTAAPVRSRAEHQQSRLAAVNLAASVRPHDSGGAILRSARCSTRPRGSALEAFLGRPIDAAI